MQICPMGLVCCQALSAHKNTWMCTNTHSSTHMCACVQKVSEIMSVCRHLPFQGVPQSPSVLALRLSVSVSAFSHSENPGFQQRPRIIYSSLSDMPTDFLSLHSNNYYKYTFYKELGFVVDSLLLISGSMVK